MRIDIWSDIVCPFCYIGRANLEAALRQLGIAADVHHKAYRLQPGQAPVPVAQMLAQKYGLTGPAAEAQHRRVEAMAAEAGLTVHLGGTRIGDTLDAHRLVKLAGAGGREAQMLERLYRAYFTEGRDVFSRASLAALGEEAGLDRAAAEAMLSGDAHTAEVETDRRFADSLNVRGVPFVAIDQALAVMGAQPVEAFVAALSSRIPANDGKACAVDGRG